MNMKEVRAIAIDRGVPPGRMTKVNMIRAIQKAEGNMECFMTGQALLCAQACCMWRPDCR